MNQRFVSSQLKGLHWVNRIDEKIGIVEMYFERVRCSYESQTVNVVTDQFELILTSALLSIVAEGAGRAI